ncbi:MAG: VIT1/CCC1 transporter family protein, partial [Nitrososphaerales archaeon]
MTFEQIPEPHSTGTGSKLRDYILGSQDGLVNVLGLVLGLAIATRDLRIVLIGGLAAAFAESIA